MKQEVTHGDQDTVLTMLEALSGYYECPKDAKGKRLGPLVGYAGKYESAGLKKQFVGDTYINFAVADQYPAVLKSFAESIMKGSPKIDVICGPQMGGIAIGILCALVHDTRFACIEKQVTQLETPLLREQSNLALLRHSIYPDDQVMIIEDVINNFSTTKEAIELIESFGGKVIRIGALLNRSPLEIASQEFYTYKDTKIPIVSLVRKQIPQWKQEDEAVAEDIANGNVILKPKNDWATLAYAMGKN